jgi:peptidase S41-like protein
MSAGVIPPTRLLADFRAELTADLLTPDDRKLIVDQAALMVEGLYVHLEQKRALYGVEPARRIRLLRRQLPQLSDAEFHARLSEIISDLQDLHTLYNLPSPYSGGFVILGFRLERYWEGGVARWLVSGVDTAFVEERSKLVAGAEITHWNGVPIAVAAARYAEREAGSNPAARLARGLDAMTQRPIWLSLLPDEDWVDLRFNVDGEVAEARVPWLLITDLGTTADEGNQSQGRQLARLRGVDRRTEVVRQVKKALFASGENDLPDEEIPTDLPDVQARCVTTPAGRFGYIRIHSFGDPDNNLVEGIAGLLEDLPRDGLILDVRGNPGGVVSSAERLLQLFTPRRIQPEPFQLAGTDLVANLCQKVPNLFRSWAASVQESIMLGAQHTGAIPVTSYEDANNLGQRYHGPVVLVTDALCYSATDMMAAGFQDHEIGPVLGVDRTTGAGGAFVMNTLDFVVSWAGSPFEPLPAGSELTCSMGRSLRVGRRSGQPLEDLGVAADEYHPFTRRDLLGRNIDLLTHAGELLASKMSRRLDVTAKASDHGTLLEIIAENVSNIDVYAAGRPIHSGSVQEGRNQIEIPVAEHESVRIRVEGYAGDTLVAARDLNPG